MHFNDAVTKQMEIMDRMLYLQATLDINQHMDENEIKVIKKEIKQLQLAFDEQTEEVIRSYLKEKEATSI
ncbi:hypothetical protein EJF36_04260 [Bacillus sp. HMF5848]|uniref:YgaB family protein n=1 Tax=Bacillus sp. HMF5848 TaxID=2495421 RepID=UPI000F7B9643|nr:YgaB family protein [Bacillus sp. HMF5848]RSK26151.1 hypothetical protein EJF36_04260 [Bacillus sp. HMF5848]